MTVSDDDLRAIWQHESTDVPSDRSACLTEVAWARLLSNEADDGERARAVDHIGSCTACADEYRLLYPLQSWAAEVEQVLLHDDAVQRVGSTRWREWFSLPRPALALAAVAVLLVMATVPLYLLVGSRRQNARLEAQLAQDKDALLSTRASLATLQEEVRGRPSVQTAEQLNALQRQLAQLSTPQLDVSIVDLDPYDTAGVRGSPDPQIVTADPDASLVTLILNFAPLAARSTLEVEVSDQSGQSRWVGRTERDRSTASLTLALPTQGYPAGRYDIRVFDVTRGRTPLATYAVIIRPPPAQSR